MRKLQELVKEAKTAIEKVHGELFTMATNGGPNTYERDATLVAAELKGLRERHNNQAETIGANIREINDLKQRLAIIADQRDRHRASAEKLRETRTEVRSVLGAKFGERTADAAKRAVEARANFSEARIRTILGAKLSETTEQAAARVMKPGGKMALAVTNLRKARAEVREILGARPGEGSRAAARRVVSQLEKQPIYPKTSFDRSTVCHVYNELNEMAQRAGYPPGSVGAYVRRLAVGKKTYAE